MRKGCSNLEEGHSGVGLVFEKASHKLRQGVQRSCRGMLRHRGQKLGERLRIKPRIAQVLPNWCKGRRHSLTLSSAALDHDLGSSTECDRSATRTAITGHFETEGEQLMCSVR